MNATTANTTALNNEARYQWMRFAMGLASSTAALLGTAWVSTNVVLKKVADTA